jgi:hypothetical protein
MTLSCQQCSGQALQISSLLGVVLQRLDARCAMPVDRSP